jgi:acyl-CoA reductase-like NAD-dependent aldehyde dehydrogenase
MISALLAGNAVLLKPSELSLPVGALLISLFGKLNLPDGLVQWVIGDGQAGALLIDAAPDLVFFTGGTAAGRAVMRRAARHPIPVLLELGGKDAMLVFADAHLQRACDAALYGAFLNSGQVCIAVERLYVQRNAYESFVQDLCAGAARLKAGRNGEGDIGAMTSPRQIEIVAAHYEDALRQGARASGPLIRDGNYLQPVVLWNVHHGMQVMREETFGPLLPVMAFDDEDDAVRSANDSLFGLNASIWSGNLQKAERVARRLQVGNWMINDVLKNVGHPGLPFGGVRHSGFGRYHGAEGLRNFTYSVSCMISRSRLPKEPNWFPYSEERYRQFRAYVDCLYGEGSLYHRIKRNWRALQAFRDYAAFDFKQRILNLKLYLQPWKRDD